MGLVEEDPEARMLQQGARSLEAVGGRIAEGDHEGAARQFVEDFAFGPGAWDSELPARVFSDLRGSASPPSRTSAPGPGTLHTYPASERGRTCGRRR